MPKLNFFSQLTQVNYFDMLTFPLGAGRKNQLVRANVNFQTPGYACSSNSWLLSIWEVDILGIGENFGKLASENARRRVALVSPFLQKFTCYPEREPALFSRAQAPISSRSPTNINKGLDEINDVLLSSMNRSVNSPNRLS